MIEGLEEALRKVADAADIPGIDSMHDRFTALGYEIPPSTGILSTAKLVSENCAEVLALTPKLQLLNVGSTSYTVYGVVNFDHLACLMVHLQLQGGPRPAIVTKVHTRPRIVGLCLTPVLRLCHSSQDQLVGFYDLGQALVKSVIRDGKSDLPLVLAEEICATVSAANAAVRGDTQDLSMLDSGTPLFKAFLKYHKTLLPPELLPAISALTK